MNVERLYSLLLHAVSDIDDCNTPELLASLRGSTQQLASQPQHPDIQREFSNQRSQLMVALGRAASNSFSPGIASDLDDLSISQNLGESLANRIDIVFAQNEFTLAVASDQLIEIEAQLLSLHEHLKNTVSALEALGIGKDELAPGEVEASVILPRSAVDNSLRSLAEEFRELERVFSDVTELATGSRPKTAVRSIASSDFSVYVELVPEAAAFLAVAIERVIALYRTLLDIRRIRSEAAAQGISDDRLEGIDDHIEQHMDRGLDETVEQLFDEMEIAVSSDGRKNELKVSFRKTLSEVAKRIDRGYRFDIRLGELTEDVDEEDSEAGKESSLASSLKIIVKSREGLASFQLEGEPILQLPSSDSDDDS